MNKAFWKFLKKEEAGGHYYFELKASESAGRAVAIGKPDAQDKTKPEAPENACSCLKGEDAKRFLEELHKEETTPSPEKAEFLKECHELYLRSKPENAFPEKCQNHGGNVPHTRSTDGIHCSFCLLPVFRKSDKGINCKECGHTHEDNDELREDRRLNPHRQLESKPEKPVFKPTGKYVYPYGWESRRVESKPSKKKVR
jgi:hypothetical protein